MDWREGEVIYYRAWAKNTANQTGYGGQQSVKLAVTGVSPGGPGPIGGIGIVTDRGFPAFILSLARYQGMDNAFGHWGFMFEIMVGLALIFGIFIVMLAFKHEPLAAQIMAVILAVVELITLGAFIFTGWLGIWPLIIIAVIFVAILGLYIKTKVGTTGIA